MAGGNVARFPWMAPACVRLTAVEIARWRAYDSLRPTPVWPEPGWDVPDIACPTCEDDRRGIRVGEWSTWMPCPDCPGDDRAQELFWDMERGK